MVVRLRSEFSRKQFISATSDALKAAVRAELQLLIQRLLAVPRPAQVHPVDSTVANVALPGPSSQYPGATHA